MVAKWLIVGEEECCNATSKQTAAAMAAAGWPSVATESGREGLAHSVKTQTATATTAGTVSFIP